MFYQSTDDPTNDPTSDTTTDPTIHLTNDTTDPTSNPTNKVTFEPSDDVCVFNVFILIGKQIIKVQEINVELYSLKELSDFINNEKLPLYITFAEDIGIFEDLDKNKFDPNIHLQYFKAMVTKSPSQYVAMDAQRMTYALLLFSIFAIDILCDIKIYYASNNKLKKEKTDIINWIYAQQIISNPEKGIKYAGFRGGSFIGIPFDNNSKSNQDRIYLGFLSEILLFFFLVL